MNSLVSAELNSALMDTKGHGSDSSDKIEYKYKRTLMSFYKHLYLCIEH